MTPEQFFASTADWSSGTWFQREAAWAMTRDHFVLIKSRSGHDVYLARFWITPPAIYRDDSGDERWNSEKSLLLHCFIRPDDDGALHDHPWDFRTTVLAGGYREEVPAPYWNVSSPYGPRGFDSHERRVGDSVVHLANDLHRVAAILPGTWTLIRTQAKIRSWYFHPPGKQRVPWRDYLAGVRGGEDATPIQGHEIEHKSAGT